MKQKNKITQKIILILILTILSLSIQSCTQSREIFPKYAGTEGVIVDFLKNAPPPRVTEGSDANVMIEVANKGAYDLPPGETFVNLRFNPLHFNIDMADPNFELAVNPEGILGTIQGKSEAWPEGESFVLPLAKLNVQKIPGTMEQPETNLELTACYSYKTYLTQMICLDTDIYEVDSDPICRNRGSYAFSNQGAPIAINKIDVDMLPMGFVETRPGVAVNVPVIDSSGELIGIAPETTTEKLILIEPVIRIYAKNVGRGSVFISNEPNVPTADLCTLAQESIFYENELGKNQEFNKVKLSNMTLDGFEMDCEDTVLNLANPKDYITCRLHANQTGYLRQNLQVPLSAELEYYYRESVTKPIEIQRTN